MIPALPDRDLKHIKRVAGTYNMIANLFWSVLVLVPVSVFCYRHMSLQMLWMFIGTSVASLILPGSFFDKIQLARSAAVYKRWGINFFNRFTQNGTIINGLLHRKYPGYQLVSKRPAAIKSILGRTYMFEKFHFMMFVFFLLTAIFAMLEKYYAWAIFIFAGNLVYNVYPIFLQQYIRIRLRSFIVKDVS